MAALATLTLHAADAEVEKDYSKYHRLDGALGTIQYPATDKETKHLAGVEGKKDEAEKFDVLPGNKGKRVAWFGIVREVKEDKEKKRTELLLQHNFFDGPTDTHIQIVSLNGGGDFKVTLEGTGHNLGKLSLVRIVGVVKEEEKDVPTVQAEYVRNWERGMFAFMNYGTDKSNEKWIKLRKVKGDGDEYASRPDDKYYRNKYWENDLTLPQKKIRKDSRRFARFDVKAVRNSLFSQIPLDFACNLPNILLSRPEV